MNYCFIRQHKEFNLTISWNDVNSKIKTNRVVLQVLHAWQHEAHSLRMRVVVCLVTRSFAEYIDLHCKLKTKKTIFAKLAACSITNKTVRLYFHKARKKKKKKKKKKEKKDEDGWPAILCPFQR